MNSRGGKTILTPHGTKLLHQQQFQWLAGEWGQLLQADHLASTYLLGLSLFFSYMRYTHLKHWHLARALLDDSKLMGSCGTTFFSTAIPFVFYLHQHKAMSLRMPL